MILISVLTFLSVSVALWLCRKMAMFLGDLRRKGEAQGEATCRSTGPGFLPCFCVISTEAPKMWVNEPLVDSKESTPGFQSFLLSFQISWNRDKSTSLFLF